MASNADEECISKHLRYEQINGLNIINPCPEVKINGIIFYEQ